jgi:hypothetical protein
MAVDPTCNSKENIDRASKHAMDIIDKLPQDLQLDLQQVKACLNNIAMDDHEGGDFYHTGMG